MNSIVIKPSCSKLFNFNPKLNTFHINPFHRQVSFTGFSKSHQKRPKLYASSSKLPHNHSLPTNLLSFLTPLLQNLTTFTAKYTQKTRFLQNGGIGMALLTVKSTAKSQFNPFIATLAGNPTFVSGLLALCIAQSMKVMLNFIVERKWDLRIMFSCGGMPSSHSALCTALTTSVGICNGFGDSLFPVCLGFSLIVMYDAIGVRRHAGMQAQVLNKIIEDLFQGHPMSERKLKELLGHTPSQVFAGALLGIAVACFCCQACLTPI